MKAEIKFVVSSANTSTAFAGVFQGQEPLIRLLDFEFCRLCTVPLRQIVRADDVNHHPVVGFESLYNLLLLRKKLRKIGIFFLGIWKHVKAAV